MEVGRRYGEGTELSGRGKRARRGRKVSVSVIHIRNARI